MAKKKKESKKKHLTLRMTPELFHLLKIFARKEDKTLTTLIETLLVNSEYVSCSSEATEKSVLVLKQLNECLDEMKEISRQLKKQSRMVESFLAMNSSQTERLKDDLIIREELISKLDNLGRQIEKNVYDESYKELLTFSKINKIKIKNLYEQIKLECELDKLEMDAIKEFVAAKVGEDNYDDVFEQLKKYQTHSELSNADEQQPIVPKSKASIDNETELETYLGDEDIYEDFDF